MILDLLKWFEANKSAIVESQSWESFCDSLGSRGTTLKKQGINSEYAQMYRTIKAYPHTFLPQPVMFPEAKSLTEFVTDMTWIASPCSSLLKPTGWYWVDIHRAELEKPSIAGHVDSLYVKYSDRLEQTRLALVPQDIYLTLISRNDGVLVTFGHSWLCLLPKETIAAEMPPHDKVIYLKKN